MTPSAVPGAVASDPPGGDARIHVETWAPEYGSPVDRDPAFAPAEGSVDDGVETQAWAPLDGVDDGIARVAFVDGVRRVDARLAIDDPREGPVAGICGSFAVGAVTWDRDARRSEIHDEHVERWAVLGRGRAEVLPAVDLDPPYRTVAAEHEDPEALIAVLHSGMRRAEGQLATLLARDRFVVADGPLNEVGPHHVVGFVKSHRATYLGPGNNAVVAALRRGQRTPLFAIADYGRYSWYVRLADLAGGHSWSGLARCEASAGLPLADVVTIADRTAALLPHVASEPHVDPRAPQNLVPIGALERTLRHRLGDRGLVERTLRAAVADPVRTP
ncbi:MAG TPA: hypothetical protein VIB62_00880 [Actinomycetota bacterium]